MLGWIPIIGPILNFFTGIFTKYKDVQLEKYKVDGTVDVEATKASVAIIESTKDSVGVRLARDILIFPPVVWTSLIVWDKIVDRKFPALVWGVSLLPDAIAYLPYAVMVFLLGNVAMNQWSRK